MILRETDQAQNVYITPKSNYVTSIDVLCQETNVNINYEVSEVFIKSYYVYFTLVLDLKEGFNYTIKAKNASDEVIYYGYAYCTNQTIENYSINSGEYVQRETTNEYIVYE